MRKALLLLFLLAVSIYSFSQFTNDRIVVLRVGSGTALTSSATPLFLDEYTTSGTAGIIVAVPTTTSGNVTRVTGSGSATSEGQLNLSVNGSYLTFGGYDAVPGQLNINSTAGINRVVVRVGSDGTIATTVVTTTDATAVNNSYTTNNFRSVASTDGSQFWLGGNGTASTGGVRTVAFTGSTVPVIASQVSNTTNNIRGVNIFGGQLYYSTASGTNGVYAVGAGVPTSSSNTSTIKITATDAYGYSFIDRGGGNLNCYVVSGSPAALLKFSSQDNGATWTARGSITASASLYGIAGRLEGGTPVLYAISSASSTSISNLVKLTDASVFDAAITGSFTTIASSATNTAFRGIAFAPIAPVNNLSLTFTSVATSSSLQPPAVSTALSDATDPLASTGISVDVKDNGVIIPAANYTITAVSSNTTVVPNANVSITKADGQATIKINAAAVGYADVTVTITKGSFTKTLTINVAASAGAVVPSGTRFHTGSSDASAAIAIDDNYMIVGDDEINKLFVYSRTQSGLPVTTFDFSSLLSLTDISGGAPREVDVEAAVKSPANTNRIYWLGSMSNSATSFAARPNRNRLFAVSATGTGSSTAFSYTGMYPGLRQDLITWGDAAGYNFSASALAGKDPKVIDGFNVEGLTFAPDNTTAYIAFRAPLVPTANRTKAVIAPVQNFETWFNNGSPAGSPTIGSPIELDLGGRGFRDIVRLSNGTYIILAGNYDDAPLNPAVYTWNGLAASAPLMINSFNLTGLNPEAVMEIQSSGTLLSDRLQIISDNGSAIYYNDGIEAKDLSQNNYKKFRSDVVVSGSGSVLPVVLKTFTAQKQANVSLLTWEIATPVTATRFVVERSVNGVAFTSIGTVMASSNKGSYSFTDYYQADGKIYYRIAMAEASGRVIYSPIRVINSSAMEMVTVYPNPVPAGIVTVSTQLQGLKFATLFSTSGQPVKSFSFMGSALDMSTEGLAKGSYYFVLATKEKIVSASPLVIQ